MKKLLALILALAMAVCVFAACDKKEDTKKEEKEEVEEVVLSDEELVTNTLNDFTKYYFAGDEKALEYVSEDAEVYDKLVAGVEAQAALKENMATMVEGFGMGEEYSAELEAIGNGFADDVFSNMTITVNKVTVDGDTAVADCTFTSPDFANFNPLTEDVINEAIATLTEEELEAMDYDTVEGNEAKLKFIRALFELAGDEVEEHLVSSEAKYELEKIDGKWLIVK